MYDHVSFGLTVSLDTSEWQRSSDYLPNRMEAQLDAAKMLIQAKRQQHQESSVGLMTMSGNYGYATLDVDNRPQVLVTLSQDASQLYKALSLIKVEGSAPSFAAAIRIAQHRQNKSQRQHVIAFVGSPMENANSGELQFLARALKKNGISIDIISFGEDSTNVEKLSSFIDMASHDHNSNLLSVPTGDGILLSDAIVSSAILGSASHFGNDGDFPFGVDPDLDPELALALRMSLEEERNRQSLATEISTQEPQVDSALKPSDDAEDVDVDADDELARAIAMSLDTPETDYEQRSPKRKLGEDADDS